MKILPKAEFFIYHICQLCFSALSKIASITFMLLIASVSGVGIAAVVAPVRTICISNIDFTLPAYNEHSLFEQVKT